MTNTIFNNRFKQVIVFAVIVIIALLLIKQLIVFLPGTLGAITLYIISRGYYFEFLYKRKWKKNLAALLFIFVYILILALPIYLTITLVSPKIHALLQNQEKIIAVAQSTADAISAKLNTQILTPENIKTAAQKISSIVPMLISGTGTVLINLFMMFFFLYFLLTGASSIEKGFASFIPLQKHNVDILAKETKSMIRANALGIPLICVVQGFTAALGYFIFGVPDWALWGFLTGVFAFFPFVGTMIIWVPLCIYLFSLGINLPAIGLTLYSLLVTGNVDYVARISLMKKIGDVHPLVTVLGVIVGLNLFGFIGLIFGPLLISYFLILVKIYINEFSTKHVNPISE